MNIKIKKLHQDAVIPAYSKTGDAGMDLCALEDFTVFQGEVKHVKTGIAMAIPEGYVGYVHSRSGLAAKKGVSIPNGPGVIDAGYRGDIGVLLSYNGQAEAGNSNPVHHQRGSYNKQGQIVYDMWPGVQFKKGDRIAQLVIQKFEAAEFEQVDSLDETDRGGGGFGSTGV